MSTERAAPPDEDDRRHAARDEGTVEDPALTAALCGWGATARYGLLRLANGWPTLVLAVASTADLIASRVVWR